MPLPLSVERRRRAFHVASEFDLAELFGNLPEDASDLRLRLRVVARNWAWQTELWAARLNAGPTTRWSSIGAAPSPSCTAAAPREDAASRERIVRA